MYFAVKRSRNLHSTTQPIVWLLRFSLHSPTNLEYIAPQHLRISVTLYTSDVISIHVYSCQTACVTTTCPKTHHDSSEELGTIYKSITYLFTYLLTFICHICLSVNRNGGLIVFQQEKYTDNTIRMTEWSTFTRMLLATWYSMSSDFPPAPPSDRPWVNKTLSKRSFVSCSSFEMSTLSCIPNTSGNCVVGKFFHKNTSTNQWLNRWLNKEIHTYVNESICLLCNVSFT